MRTVWVLGAGASRAAYCGMPLVSDFMREAHRRMRIFGGQEALLEFLREGYGYEELRSVDVEELLTLAWCDVSYLDGQGNSVLSDPEKSRRLHRALDALEKVEALFAGVLFSAQRECLQIGDRVHDSLAKEKIGAEDTIISYNYDLLIDQALWKAEKSSSDDYSVEFRGAVEWPGPSLQRGYGREPQAEPCPSRGRGVPILKLHGSLNWLRLRSTEHLKADAEVFYLPEAVSVSIGPDYWWAPLVKLRLPDGSNDPLRSGRLKPLIVPPMFGKTVWKSPLDKLWTQARTALMSCDQVVVIGLSLREADYQARWLLRTGLVANRPTGGIHIVNPSPGDRLRLQEFFLNLGRVFKYVSVDEFLDGRRVD